MNDFFKNLLEVLFPPPRRNNCPHCGGTRCFGMCSAAHKDGGQETAGDARGARQKPEEKPPEQE